jgi:hypothetical protein
VGCFELRIGHDTTARPSKSDAFLG